VSDQEKDQRKFSSEDASSSTTQGRTGSGSFPDKEYQRGGAGRRAVDRIGLPTPFQRGPSDVRRAAAG
jgi:hypothetical protein